jgi:Transposase domain (DUF772)
MLSEKPQADNGGIPLESLLDATHPLVKLTRQIDWEQFVKQFGKLYSEEGRPSVPMRVMVGLQYLRSLYNESDESVVAKWVENPYWQYFCGCETFQHTAWRAVSPDESGEVAQAGGSGGDRAVAQGDSQHGDESQGLGAGDDQAGDSRHDRAREGDCVSDGCALV